MVNASARFDSPSHSYKRLAKQSRLMKVLLLAFSVLLIEPWGCTRMNEPLRKTVSRYSVGVVNQGNQRLTEVTMSWDKFEFNHGILNPGTDKIYELVPVQFPERVTLSWTTESGEQMQRQVKIPEPPKRSFHGTMYLGIAADGSVSVTFEDLDL